MGRKKKGEKKRGGVAFEKGNPSFFLDEMMKGREGGRPGEKKNGGRNYFLHPAQEKEKRKQKEKASSLRQKGRKKKREGRSVSQTGTPFIKEREERDSSPGGGIFSQKGEELLHSHLSYNKKKRGEEGGGDRLHARW